MYPTTVDDTVIYGKKNIYADRSIDLYLVDGSQFNIWGGSILVDGEPLGSGGGGGLTVEQIIDAVSTAITEGIGIDLTYDDPAGTITIDVDKIELGLNNVDNTSDVNKPVSTAQQTALDLKANLASPTFTGIPVVPYEIYGAGWDGSNAIPTKDALYDKIEALVAAGTGVKGIVTHTGTAITATDSDAAAYLRFTGTNPTYTLPANSVTAFPIGTQIDGVGTTTAMTLIQGAGATVNKARTLVTVAADSGWTAIKVATDEWDVHGDFV